MPLQATSGAASQDAFGGNGVAVVPTYIEDVFSTYLYTGNGSTQTITNGIDLSTKGGLVWIKDRDSGAKGHALFDTARGVNLKLQSQSTNGQFSAANQLTAFNTTGFNLGSAGDPNGSGTTYVSWTFRKQPKFFDVVTYTGDGSAPRAISHSLGSTPGCIMIKKTSATGDWWVFHRSAPNQGAAYPNIGGNLYLNYTDRADTGTNPFLSAVDSTTFTLSTNQNDGMNASGATYVAYLFAHDAGGFGLTGTDNVISCGSFTTDGAAAATVSLGYEPQWVLFKRTDSSTNGDWVMFDNMRGLPATGSGSTAARLIANTSAAENPTTGDIKITSTGFVIDYVPSASFIYIACRRGPMKVPTTGTSVFNSIARTGTGATASVESGFVTDLIIDQRRSAGGDGGVVWDRLRGVEKYLFTSTTGAEGTTTNSLTSFANMNGVTVGADSGQVINVSGEPWINWMFRRAPSFFDEVCYTGTGSATTFAHNLGVVPELMIVKRRNSANSWTVYSASALNTQYFELNSTIGATVGTTRWNSTSPTASVFTVGTIATTNAAGGTYVNYLFATCAGVSKVGSYTGTGTTLQVNCGFTGGARFVLIKRSDVDGDGWYVWDSARGIIAGNDPYLLLNSTAAEVTGTDYVDTYSAGFEISSTAPAAINANGGTFIFLAIA